MAARSGHGKSAFGLVLILTSLIVASGGAASQNTFPRASCAGWRYATTLQWRGTTETGGLQGTLVVTLDTRTGRYVAKRDYGLYSVAEGFDGKLDWVQDRSGAAHFLDSRSAQAISVSQRWLRQRGWCSLEKEPEIRLPFNRLIRHYCEWRDGGNGILVPMLELEDDPDDESVETIKLTAATVATKAPAANDFVRPPQPRDYAVLGETSSTTVPYEDDGIGRIYVPVLINGKGPFAFELDTGGHLRLTAATAEQVGISGVGNLSSTGGGTGIAHVGLVRTEEIRIGAAVIRNQVASVSSRSTAADDRGPRPPRAGLLGLELFERFVVQLDRTDKTMTLTPVESFKRRPKGIALPIHFNEDAPLAAGTFEGIGGEFELDSGDAGPAIIEGFWAQQRGLGERLVQGIEWSGSGVGGDYKDILTRGDFALGPLSLPHEVVSYVGVVERGSESTRQQAGVIGESSLYRFDMTYDYGRLRVWISPNATIPLRPFNRAGMRLTRASPQSYVITAVVANSAAQAVGLNPGDSVLEVNGRPASQLAPSDLAVILSGPIGTDVEMLVVPKGARDPLSKHIRLKEVVP